MQGKCTEERGNPYLTTSINKHFNRKTRYITHTKSSRTQNKHNSQHQKFRNSLIIQSIITICTQLHTN